MKANILLYFAPLAGAIALPQSLNLPRAEFDTSKAILGRLTYGGPGCPEGSIEAKLDTGYSFFTLLFKSFFDGNDANTAVTEVRKNCQLSLSIIHPTRFQYSVLAVETPGDYVYHGSKPGFKLSARTTYSYPGVLDPPQSDTCPLISYFTTQCTAEQTSTVWPPCGDCGIMNLNNEGILTKTGPSSLKSTAKIGFWMLYHVRFQYCN